MVRGKKKESTLEGGLKTTNDMAPVQPLSDLISGIEVLDVKMGSEPFSIANLRKGAKSISFVENNTVASASNHPPKPQSRGNKNGASRGGRKNWNNNNGRRPFRPQLKKQEVLEMPADIETADYTISADNVEFFSGPGHFISALYPITMNVDGNEYNSVEHYYQACKIFTLVGKEAAAVTKSASTPIEVKQIAKKLLTGKVTKAEIETWKQNESLSILKHAISQKFSQDQELKKKLLDTGDKILIQAYNGDNFFAAGGNEKFSSDWVRSHTNEIIKIPAELTADTFQYSPIIVNGKNALGFLTMQVRKELREESIA